jgi:hypothetical protein
MKIQILLLLSLIFAVSLLGSAQTKTVTNADLEKYRQRREKADADYLATYKQRGLPSPEELKRREEARHEWLRDFSQKAEAERQISAADLAARANALRSEIVSGEAQANYLRDLLNRYPGQQVFYSSFFTPYFRQRNRGVVYNGYSYGSPIIDTRIQTSGVRINTTPTRIQTNPGTYRGGAVGRRYYNSGASLFGGYGIPVLPEDNRSYQRDELISRLQLIEQQLAGLRAQWDLLEDEAHRSGFRIE